MLCLAAALNFKSTTMLITAGEKVGRLNYEELMAESFGNAGIHTFSLFAGVLAFGAMSAYLVIVGDTIPQILQASGITTGAFADRASVIGIFGIFCILPVSLLKDLSKLAYTSCISVLADLLLTVIVLATASGEARYATASRRSPLLFRGVYIVHRRLFHGDYYTSSFHTRVDCWCEGGFPWTQFSYKVSMF